MTWVYIAVFSVAVAFVLMQLFKFFVSAPEIAAQEEASKRKNAKKNTSQKSKLKSTDSTPKLQETSTPQDTPSPSTKEDIPKKKALPPVPVVSPVLPVPQAEAPKDAKHAKEGKPAGKPAVPPKPYKEPKLKNPQKELQSSSELTPSSGNESADATEPTAHVVAEKKQKDKGKKPDSEKKVVEEKKPEEKKPKGKKKADKVATEVTDEDLMRQWTADYLAPPADASPAASAGPAITVQPWKQVGSMDSQVEEMRSRVAALEAELTASRDTVKTTHEKQLEALSKATRAHQAAEVHLATIERLKRELEVAREGGVSSNDALRRKNYLREALPEKLVVPFGSVVADAQKERDREKEKEKEKSKDKDRREEKEREERDKHEKQEKQEKENQEKDKHEREKSEREREEQERQRQDKQSAVLKKRIAELEASEKTLQEQLNATESLNSYLTASLAAEIKEGGKNASAGKAAGSEAASAQLTKKVEELSQQLSKKEHEAQEKIKSLTEQLHSSKSTEEIHARALSDATAQVDQLHAKLTALEANHAKGSGSEETISQLQQSLQEEKEKSDTATQQAELAEAAKLTYKGKLEELQKSTADQLTKSEAQKKTSEAAIAQLEERLAQGKVHLDEATAKADKHAKELEAALASEKSAHEALRQRLAQLEGEKAHAQAGETSRLVEEANVQVAEAAKRAEEANRRANEATKHLDEAARSIQDLTAEVANVRKRLEEAEGAKAAEHAAHEKSKEELSKLSQKLEAASTHLKDAEAQASAQQRHAAEAAERLAEEKAARTEVVKRLEEVSARVKDLEAQPQQD